jgi:putative flippase GtrA
MPIVVRIKDAVRKEWRSLIKFGIVGGTSVAMKMGLYALLSRLLWIGGPKWVQNIAALTVSTVYNYTLHRYWTFNHLKPAEGSTKRYLMVLAFGYVMDASLFFLGNEILKIYDFAVILGVSMIIPCFTFVIHRVFTFHPDPYRRKPDVVQSA